MLLHRLAWHGNDPALIDGLIFLLAVKEGVRTDSDFWEGWVEQFKAHGEGLQDRVFEGKRRTLEDYVAIQLLRNFVGPRAYLSKRFPAQCQQCDAEMAAFLFRAADGRRRSTAAHPG